ncbi:conserved hypothetical protein [Denitrovibrio acetiphilus DSM 12809]|uniref:Threonine/Serine exporter ThrE domain-containing protein n=1 Tax=Denitrovibrio acetiphilus (strain DSM 12809 / NBRC 114555 / N2460) TaxID=522772 RepID=D4H299_DENA2|nr:threonine/serine exporter family protein [Denitrovibrio acetiphilus]ADD68890.1 conserved hypothetical protein [Denitrovibrio acetiphilus DSM 12809]
MFILGNFILNCLAAAFAATGFAVLFNVPKNQLVFCSIGGLLSYFVRTLLMQSGVEIIWATFVSASVVSVYGVLWAKRHNAHPKVITVASIIPMIPGVYAYKTMIAVVGLAGEDLTNETLQSAVVNGIETIFILGAIAFGLAIPNMLIYRKKTVI